MYFYIQEHARNFAEICIKYALMCKTMQIYAKLWTQYAQKCKDMQENMYKKIENIMNSICIICKLENMQKIMQKYVENMHLYATVWAGVRLGNVIHFFETLRIEGQL